MSSSSPIELSSDSEDEAAAGGLSNPISIEDSDSDQISDDDGDRDVDGGPAVIVISDDNISIEGSDSEASMVAVQSLQPPDDDDDEVTAAAAEERSDDALIGSSADRQLLIASQEEEYENSRQTDACLDQLLAVIPLMSLRAGTGLTFVTNAPAIPEVLTPARRRAFEDQGVRSFVAGRPVPREAEQCVVAVSGHYYVVGLMPSVSATASNAEPKTLEEPPPPPSRKRLQRQRSAFLDSVVKRRRF